MYMATLGKDSHLLPEKHDNRGMIAAYFLVWSRSLKTTEQSLIFSGNDHLKE